MLTDILMFAALAGAVQVAIALGLLLSQPLRPRPARPGLDFDQILGAPGFAPPQSPAFSRASVLARVLRRGKGNAPIARRSRLPHPRAP